MDIFFTERVRHPKKNGIDCTGSALEMRFTTLCLETVASLASMRARASHMLASTHTESMYCFFMKLLTQDTILVEQATGAVVSTERCGSLERELNVNRTLIVIRVISVMEINRYLLCSLFITNSCTY